MAIKKTCRMELKIKRYLEKKLHLKEGIDFVYNKQLFFGDECKIPDFIVLYNLIIVSSYCQKDYILKSLI